MFGGVGVSGAAVVVGVVGVAPSLQAKHTDKGCFTAPTPWVNSGWAEVFRRPRP
jgi:hypothetical protein